MSFTVERDDEDNSLAEFRHLLIQSGQVTSAISELAADKGTDREEIREKIAQEELNKAKLVWKLIKGRGIPGVNITVWLYKLPGEILHSGSQTDVRASLSDHNKEYGNTKTSVNYLAQTFDEGEGFSIDEIVNDFLKPDIILPGDPSFQVRRLFNEARTAERIWKTGSAEVRPYYEGIRDLVIQNTMAARKNMTSIRDLIEIDAFDGKYEEMICYKFIDPYHPDQGNRINVPWTYDRHEAIIDSGGYTPKPNHAGL